LVSNSCSNTCSDFKCTHCTPDCSVSTPSEVCVKGVCNAECDESNKCEPKIEGNTCFFDDSCNLEGCSCAYSNEVYCPEPGTISEDYCYWGQRNCVDGSGCTLTKTFIESDSICDPINGPKDTQPPIPPVLQAAVNGNSITLTWSGASDNVGIDHFIIYRSTNSDFSDISGNLGSDTSSFIDSGLQYSTTYSYMVGVFDASGNSANSSVISVTTGSSPEQPNPTEQLSGPSLPPSVSLLPPSVNISGCNPSWNCTGWSECSVQNLQVRICSDLSNCNTTSDKPNEIQNCIYNQTPLCIENWNCTDWSECDDNKQTRYCVDLSNCNTTSDKPNETQSCEPLSGFTGMSVAILFKPSTLSLLILLIIAIISTIINRRVNKKNK
jgi:hypothetical protein